MRERDEKGKGNSLKQCNISFSADREGTFFALKNSRGAMAPLAPLASWGLFLGYHFCFTHLSDKTSLFVKKKSLLSSVKAMCD